MSTVERATVRMYKRLLGDCLLLKVQQDDGRERRILIDCGLLQGLRNGKQRIQNVARHIASDCPHPEDPTKGYVDLLVVTQQHFDHVGGFIQAHDILLNPDCLQYGEIWMAWTEDPEDATAKTLRGWLDRRRKALARFAAALKTDAPPRLAPDVINGLADFIGPVDDDGLGVSGRGGLTMNSVFDAIKRQASVRYLAPGTIAHTPGDTPLEVAVLGPPKRDARLFKDRPSAGKTKETYLDEELSNYSIFAADAPGAGAGELNLEAPFAKRYWQGYDRASIQAAARQGTDDQQWLRARYFAPSDDQGRDQVYRTIDADWTQSFSSLALSLDADTNNTSLVLAFRLPDGDFLLFPADAQVGNWLSWHDQTYPFSDGPLTAEQILNRTRLYKVSHHGSHNATLQAKGLEMMTHKKLAAMCSTVEDEAKKPGRGWLMPNPAVKNSVIERTQGRLLRGDRNWSEDPDVREHSADNGWFANAVREKGDPASYVDYEVYP